MKNLFVRETLLGILPIFIICLVLGISLLNPAMAADGNILENNDSNMTFDTTEIQYRVNDDGEIVPGEMPNWGISLSASDVTPAGMTLICSQSGGDITGTLMTGP